MTVEKFFISCTLICVTYFYFRKLFILQYATLWFTHIIVSQRTTSSKCSDHTKCQCDFVNATYIKAVCRHISKIPNFYENVRFIDVSHNEIRNISSQVKFPKNVEYIDLSYCEISVVEPNVFKDLHRLVYLDVSHNNQFTFENLQILANDLQFTPIKVLKFIAIHCERGMGTVFKKSYLKSLSNSSVEELHLSSNRIELVEDNVINNFPRTLKKIHCSENRFSFGFYVLEILSLPNLQVLNISGMNWFSNPIVAFERPCKDHPISFAEDVLGFPFRTEGLTFSWKKRDFNVTFYLPPSLEVIDLRHSIFVYDPAVKHYRFQGPGIREFYSQGNFFRILTNSNFGHNCKVVDVSNNYCTYIHPEFFANGGNITHLNLNNNYLGDFIETEIASAVFQSLRKLEYLDLSMNRIYKLSSSLFVKSDNLKILNISSNSIGGLSFDLKNLVNLETFDMSRNKLRALTERNMKDLEDIGRGGRLVVDFSGNDLLCSCETLSFLQWTKKQMALNVIRFHNYKAYKCEYKNTTMTSFEHIDAIINQLQLECSPRAWIVLICAATIVAFLCMIISGISYRYRWKIRYLYYAAKRTFGANKAENPRFQKFYRYDAFLSFADEDSEIAIERIADCLEQEGEVSICYNTRDFIPGKAIDQNIADAVHESRHTICLVSKSFFDSYWCMREFEFARMEAMYGRGGEDVLFLILSYDFQPDNVPLSLMNLIETRCYIELPPEGCEVQNRLFIERLKNAISK